jgi:hypothetical protein
MAVKKAAGIAQITVAELVEDLSIYPRHAVDDAHVASLVRALESSATFPPIVAERRTKRIVDGWHRARAYRRVLGPEAVVDVELRHYRSEADLLLDAVSMNSVHGRKLDRIDEVRIVVMLQRAHVDEARIAVALHVPEQHVVKLKIRVAHADHQSTGTVPGTREVALKRPVAWMAGQRFTDEQVEAHAVLPGTSFLLLARQLTRALSAKMVNLGDSKLVDQLRELQAALGESLARVVA